MTDKLKIAIYGKKNSGKNTTCRYIGKSLKTNLKANKKYSYLSAKNLAFADPIKEMILTMFPKANKYDLFASSSRRDNIIPDAFKDGIPLTYRQALIDIGTLAREYNPLVWVNNLENRLTQYGYRNLITVSDLRFPEEFDFLRRENFIIVKLVRDSVEKSSDKTETALDLYKDNKFDFVLDNSQNINFLKMQIDDMVRKISP